MNGGEIMRSAKAVAVELLDNMPDDSTWDDIMYEFYVRQRIERAVEAAETGNVVPQEDVERRFVS